MIDESPQGAPDDSTSGGNPPPANPPANNAQPLALREVPSYGTLGFFLTQEIPYRLEELQIAFLNLEKQAEFPPLQPIAAEAATAGIPAMNGNDIRELEERFAGDQGIQRFGWLGGASVYSPQKGRLEKGPDGRDDDKADPEDIIYLQRSDGKYLAKTDEGLDFVDSPDPKKRVQISKVVSIPYRWRRPGQAVAETRQTHLLICYNGPSNN